MIDYLTRRVNPNDKKSLWCIVGLVDGKVVAYSHASKTKVELEKWRINALGPGGACSVRTAKTKLKQTIRPTKDGLWSWQIAPLETPKNVLMVGECKTLAEARKMGGIGWELFRTHEQPELLGRVLNMLENTGKWVIVK